MAIRSNLRSLGRAGARKPAAILLALATATFSVVASDPASAAAPEFTLQPVVGTAGCIPLSPNCQTTIVVNGSDLPVAAPAAIGVGLYGNNTFVTVENTTDDWLAGRDTNTFTSCEVMIGASSSTELVFQVGGLGLCPFTYAVAPGDNLNVKIYGAEGNATQSTTALTPGAEPSVSAVVPVYGPIGGGTTDEPGSGRVTVTSASVDAPIAAWFGGGATTDITPSGTPGEYLVVPPPSPASQGKEGVSVQLVDPSNGASVVNCLAILPDGCANQYFYMDPGTGSYDSGPDPYALNWSAALAGAVPVASSACVTGTSGVSAGLAIGGSLTGGPLKLDASLGLSYSTLNVPEALIGSATLTVDKPLVITVALSGSVSGCQQIPIPQLSIPNVAGFYFVVGGSITAAANLTVTINEGTYKLTGGWIPGALPFVNMESNCVDANGQPATQCVTTALSASLTGVLSVSPLWFQIGPSVANVGAGLTAAATGIITIDENGTSVDGDICAGGNYLAQINVGPVNVNKAGTWLGPFNIIGNGALCPLGDASNGSTAPDAPTNLAATAGDTTADLAWEAPASNGGSPITGYNVYGSTTPGGQGATPLNAAPLAADATTFTATGLTNGTPYYFTVKAINDVGTSEASNEATATPTAIVSVPWTTEELAALVAAADELGTTPEDLQYQSVALLAFLIGVRGDTTVTPWDPTPRGTDEVVVTTWPPTDLHIIDTATAKYAIDAIDAHRLGIYFVLFLLAL